MHICPECHEECYCDGALTLLPVIVNAAGGSVCYCPCNESDVEALASEVRKLRKRIARIPRLYLTSPDEDEDE